MNDTQLTRWLEQAGFSGTMPDDIDRPLGDGTTPLMYAARIGDVDALSALLARGANPALVNADGNGALWFACFADSEAGVSALVKAGAPLDMQNVNGATALIYCASAGKTPLVRMLLDAGADHALMTLDDFTALELAANVQCMRMLRNAKAAVHA